MTCKCRGSHKSVAMLGRGYMVVQNHYLRGTKQARGPQFGQEGIWSYSTIIWAPPRDPKAEWRHVVR